ncbi:hypothetical protein Q5P01_001352 [Channa striata]|uniref:Apolipoprotein M n=1 Tax=Channa striata TaxID=64152 RepID=A0AA88NS41_CHASR|nr:hypothetical protein Q5P01_001352 [Channa striata]
MKRDRDTSITMKTLCVAVVVLSLSSVCRPAPLACDKLLKPVDKSPDLSGRWFVIAMSSDVCLIPALLNSLLWPSFAVDFTAQSTPNIYESNVTFKILDYCGAEPETIFFERNILFDVDSNNAPIDTAEVLLHTGCPDCLILKGNDSIDSLLLLSRRQKVTEAELKEFRMQADCLEWSEPEVLNSDHDYKNCKSFDDVEATDEEIWNKMYERLKETYNVPLQCLTKDIYDFSKALYAVTL